ncbi:MAG: alpha-ketoglutarate-dependent dioxygenase AlkB [Pseudomonadales bacterium]|jgi:alkylated DNA repair dioxygenase AlkB|nr:alpha-ketoglutarate-dependent dioxygenase AlkB [Pseudomonadales bacterium]
MRASYQRIELADGALALFADAFVAEAPAWSAALMQEVRWEQHWLTLFGRRIAAPRLSAWYADAGCNYRYSGLSLAAQPFTPVLAQIRACTEALAGHGFNSVLLNLYRDGADGMSWHSDDEPELGPAPLIASVSLGATRRLLLRRRDAHQTRFGLDLGDGSLLLMEPPLQRHWQHSVAKTRRATGPRINLTWRRILPG